MAANTVIQKYPPTWNMQQVQFANINLAIEGVYFPFFQEIEYTDSVDVEEGRGASPYPMGTTSGQYKASGNISVLLSMRKLFLDLIAQFSPGGNSIYDAVFNLQAQWQMRPSRTQLDTPVITDQLFGCRLTGGGITASSGPGVVMVKYPMNIQLVIHDGRLPLAGVDF